MTNPNLIGNNKVCGACNGSRIVPDSGPFGFSLQCRTCRGKGFVKLSDAEIIRRTCDEARRTYWPAAYARWAASVPAKDTVK